jgi:hypothetical protein
MWTLNAQSEGGIIAARNLNDLFRAICLITALRCLSNFSQEIIIQTTHIETKIRKMKLELFIKI